jgi:hypothetical protein
MYPSYLRGRALSLIGEEAAAAAEFGKVLDNPGMTLNFPTAILARLELARTLAATRHFDGAKSAYRDLLNRWKGADPDIPLLIAARKEMSALPR